ncbi:MAG TPA: hypothetical protein VHM02_01540, partial [Thermoanaerobaculia bacterium]|nr:hypothetical protein [Thermoanaerobaculia bacterium]
ATRRQSMDSGGSLAADGPPVTCRLRSSPPGMATASDQRSLPRRFFRLAAVDLLASPTGWRC